MSSLRAIALFILFVLAAGFLVAFASLIPMSLEIAGAFIAEPPTPVSQTGSSATPRVARPLLATITSKPVRVAVPSPTPDPLAPHFLFDRPVGVDAPGPIPNRLYLYGTTEHDEYEVHHGVDFDNNPTGTPLLAVSGGTVVTAGDDREPLCGDKGDTVCGRHLKFYGLVTVIRLDETYQGRPLFALYGHMDRIDVSVGQHVRRGDVIGAIGMTGIAIGPHAQLEIRLGENDYASTRNPMLWVQPLAGRGLLAGRYVNANGEPVQGATIDIYRAEEPTVFYRETETYGRDEQGGVNSDEALEENFLMNDLPPGEYIVQVIGRTYRRQITIQEGELTFVELGGAR